MISIHNCLILWTIFCKKVSEFVLNSTLLAVYSQLKGIHHKQLQKSFCIQFEWKFAHSSIQQLDFKVWCGILSIKMNDIAQWYHFNTVELEKRGNLIECEEKCIVLCKNISSNMVSLFIKHRLSNISNLYITNNNSYVWYFLFVGFLTFRHIGDYQNTDTQHFLYS